MEPHPTTDTQARHTPDVKKNLQELTRVYMESMGAYRSSQRAVERERDSLIEAARKNIDESMLAKHGAEIERLRVIAVESGKMMVAEQDRVAVLAKDAPYPMGTRLMKMMVDPNTRYSRVQKQIPTGKFGVLEVVTSDTVFASNLTWRKPGIGDYIVRCLKKDGSPSLKFERFRKWQWKPADGAEGGAK